MTAPTSPIADAWARARASVNAGASRRSFREYVDAVNPRYRWYRHCEILADALQSVADGRITRLMCFEPPRHGKSEEISRLFTGYYLEQHPERWVGLSAYAAGLAFTLSRNARDNYQRAGNRFRDGAAGVEHWETASGGGMWAAGVGGPITGKGAHLLIVDDPIKNAEEANSETIREKHKDWWRSTFYTRAEPDAAIVVVQTRWHEDDLAGWLLAQEEDEDPERWHILNLDAIHDAEPTVFPSSCTVLPDWRSEGQALCPERYPIEKLNKIQRRIGGYYFGALYQQRPTALAGDVFKRDWWKYYTLPGVPIPDVPVLPDRLQRVVQSWDMAFKDEAENDKVSGQVWAQHGVRYYLLDRVNERMSFTASCQAVVSMSAKWPAARAKYIEDKANGPAIRDSLRRTIVGIVAVKPDGGKLARAYAVQPLVEAGHVYLPHPKIAPWVEDFIRELAQFPRGAHDDDVDACTQALNRLARSARELPPEEDVDDYGPIPQPLIHEHAQQMSRPRTRRSAANSDRPTDTDFGDY